VPPFNVWARECDTCMGVGTLPDWDYHDNPLTEPCDDCDGTGIMRDPSDEWDHMDVADVGDCLRETLPCSRCGRAAPFRLHEGWTVGHAVPVLCEDCLPQVDAEHRAGVDADRVARGLRRALQRVEGGRNA